MGHSAASFEGCEYLVRATGTFPGHVNFSGSGIKEVADLYLAEHLYESISRIADFSDCKNLREVPLHIRNNKSVRIDEETTGRILKYELAKKNAKKFVRSMDSPEI